MSVLSPPAALACPHPQASNPAASARWPPRSQSPSSSSSRRADYPPAPSSTMPAAPRLGTRSREPAAALPITPPIIHRQMTFAIITPALIVGGFAERMKFSAMLVFMSAWSLLVYCPVAHSVWFTNGDAGDARNGWMTYGRLYRKKLGDGHEARGLLLLLMMISSHLSHNAALLLPLRCLLCTFPRPGEAGNGKPRRGSLLTIRRSLAFPPRFCPRSSAPASSTLPAAPWCTSTAGPRRSSPRWCSGSATGSPRAPLNPTTSASRSSGRRCSGSDGAWRACATPRTASGLPPSRLPSAEKGGAAAHRTSGAEDDLSE